MLLEVEQGGKLVTKVRRLKVKALPAKLPDAVTIDISPLKIGSHIRVRDLSVEGVAFLDSPSNVIVGVQMTRNVVAAELIRIISFKVLNNSALRNLISVPFGV